MAEITCLPTGPTSMMSGIGHMAVERVCQPNVRFREATNIA